MAQDGKEDLRKLMQAFDTLPPDIVYDVAYNCNFDVVKSIAMLKELTSRNDDSFQKVSYGGTRRKTGAQSEVAQRIEKSNYIRIMEVINQGWKVLVLMRGLPGSGKSTLAKEIVKNTVNGPPSEFIFSADDYFCRNGKYEYDIKKLDNAHRYCQERCFAAMRKGVSPIIIDNTNVREWEMEMYCTMGVEFCYIIEICEPETVWARDPDVLSRKNIHRVPKDKIIKMMNDFQWQITTKSMLRGFNLLYRDPMPQKRMYPPLHISRPPPDIEMEEDQQLKIAKLLSLQESERSAASNHFQEEEEFLFQKKLPPIIEYIHKPPKIESSSAENPDSTTEAKVDKSTIKEYVDKFNNKQEAVPEVIDEPKVESKMETNVEQKLEQTNAEAQVNSDVSLIDLDEIPTAGAPTVSGHFPLMPVQVQNTSAKSESEIQNNKKMKSNDYDTMAKGNYSTNAFQLSSNANQTNGFNTVTSQPEFNFSNINFSSSYASNNHSNKPEPKNTNLSRVNSSFGSWEAMQSWNNHNPSPTSKPGDDVLSSWGTSITKIQSWDSIIPLKSTSEPAITITRSPEIPAKAVQMSDKQTNTSAQDFNFALNCPDKSAGGFVLVGSKKPINPPNVLVKNPIRNKIMVDIGCMTEEDILLGAEQTADHVAQLREFFPHIPIEYMLEVYEKCQKDINWTVDLLSETDYTTLPQQQQKERKQPEPMEQLDNFTTATSMNHLNSWEMVDPLQEVLERTRKEDEIMKLKRQLEENVTFKREHYSDHTWQIKNIKQGCYTLQNSQCEGNEPSEVAENSSLSDSDDIADESFNEETNKLHQIDLGPLLVTQLEKIFGNVENIDKSFSTVVQMPESLARQLHALYLESICLQIENHSNTLSRDEELAKQMQEEEHNSNEPNLKRIMDEQLAEFLQQKDLQQYRNLSPDDLATRLTKIKLYETFPTLQKSIVDDVLAACNYKYKDAVIVLIGSVEKNTIQGKGNLWEPPISEGTLQEMKTETAMIEKHQDDEDDEEASGRTADSFRDEANECQKRRNHLQDLVNMYHQKGMGEVAAFYSELARKAQQQLDYLNQKASYLYMYENSAKVSNGITIDLHYLYVREAVAALDVFIDHQVQQIIKQNKKQKDFFVITGRGNRSTNGKSKIKPAVIQRLRKRKVRFSEMNPGLLKIKLHKNLAMATDI